MVFFDEAHRLEGRSADALLKLAEEPPPWLTFVFASSERQGVRPALLSRCLHLETRLLDRATALAWLAKVCADELITYEVAALKMLIDRAHGSPREMLSTLGHVGLQGHVDVQAVGRALGMQWTHHLIGYAQALGRGDLESQLTALDGWTATPRAKAEAIRDLVLFLHNYEVSTPRIAEFVNPAFYQVPEADRRQLAAQLTAAGELAGLKADDFWMTMMSFWTKEWPAELDHPTTFQMLVRRFHRLVNPEFVGLRDQVALSTLPAIQRRRLRVHRRASSDMAGAPSSPRLDHDDVREIWSAASFLLQEHAAPLNLRVTIKQTLEGRHLHRAAAALTTKLMHELRMRSDAWAGHRNLHWLYVHECDETGREFVTNLVAHLQPECLSRAEDWLRQATPRLAGQLGVCAASDLVIQRFERKSTKAKVNTHWDLVQVLCRGVDPGLVPEGSVKPLIELLQIPDRLRGQVGAPDCRRRRGVSELIGPDVRDTARRDRLAPLSAFDDGAWDRLLSGWELDEYDERRREKKIRHQAMREIDAIHPEGGSIHQEQERRHAIAALRASWPDDPRLRRRLWCGWWGD